MKIYKIESGPVATIAYLVVDMNSGCAVIIDAPLDSCARIDTIIKNNNLKVEAILLTHTHWDHIADCSKIKELTSANVYLHKSDFYRLNEPMKHTIYPLPFMIEPVNNVEFLNMGDKIKIGSLEFEVLHTPGHTEGGLCFVEHSNKVVFVGDTLFNESIGRVDLPGGSMEQLIDSIEQHLLVLPDNYRVYSGHGPETTIAWERNNNPFLVNFEYK